MIPLIVVIIVLSVILLRYKYKAELWEMKFNLLSKRVDSLKTRKDYK